MQHHNVYRRKSAKYLVSVGGNALEYGKGKAASLARAVGNLYRKGDVVITHGNGPQVGELASEEQNASLAMLTAQTQAEIGTSMRSMLERSIPGHPEIAIVITRALVSASDPAFSNPTKPIGRFYGRKAAGIMVKKGYIMKKLIGGYRRVVPSPTPLKVPELPLIERLLDSHMLLIAGGGGGIPIIRTSNGMKLAEAVIDKDRISSLIARSLGAKIFVVLTNVDGAYLNYKKKGQKLLGKTSVSEMEAYLSGGSFEEGSMKPKVEACIDFVKHTGKSAVIGNISKAEDVVSLRHCTLITPNH